MPEATERIGIPIMTRRTAEKQRFTSKWKRRLTPLAALLPRLAWFPLLRARRLLNGRPATHARANSL